MRTRKYRAWDIKKKKMIYNPFVYDDNETLAEFSMVRLNEALKDKRFIYLEYTGLQDNSNPPKEIYEGDIIEFEEYKVVSYLQMKKAKERVVIKFPEDFLWVQTQQKELKVIGNIYENPKLLKKV